MSKIALSGNPSGTATYTIASPAGSTDRTLTLPDAAGTIVAKSGSFIAPADLGSGTPDATNFLRGDGSWQVISTTPTTTQVLDATAGASVGAVGTYALLTDMVDRSTSTGSTRAGSDLRYTNLSSQTGGTPSGTWRAMGAPFDGNPSSRGSVWLRIS
jgi:hypothetical protein